MLKPWSSQLLLISPGQEGEHLTGCVALVCPSTKAQNERVVCGAPERRLKVISSEDSLVDLQRRALRPCHGILNRLEAKIHKHWAQICLLTS
jgi:hypothetical protein